LIKEKEMDIKEALGQLDTLEDSNWTDDGAPAIEAVSSLLGRKVTRAEIIEAAPKFSRENTDLSGVTPAPKTEQNSNASLLKIFSEMEPMLPEELAQKILSKIDPKLLPEIEIMLGQQLQAIEQKEKEVEEMKRRVKLGRALTQAWIKRLIPDISNQQAIQEYIRSSNARRAEKAAEINRVLGGLKPADIAKLDPRAAIDKAFARKTARGSQRPVR
jgi:hypothetical protein